MLIGYRRTRTCDRAIRLEQECDLETQPLAHRLAFEKRFYLDVYL